MKNGNRRKFSKLHRIFCWKGTIYPLLEFGIFGQLDAKIASARYQRRIESGENGVGLARARTKAACVRADWGVLRGREEICGRRKSKSGGSRN